MKKLLFFLIICIFFTFNTDIARADTVNLFNGTVIKGKLTRVTSDLIYMKTKAGERKFSRNKIINNKDFVVIGFFNKKVVSGKVFFLNLWEIEMHTPAGILKLYRHKVRDIVLGHVHEPEEQLQIQLPEQVEEIDKNIESVTDEALMPGQELEECPRDLPVLPEPEQNIENIPDPDRVP